MKKIEIKKTLHQPHVVLNPDNGTMLFEGKSIVPNASEFFEPILTWIEDFSAIGDKLVVDFKLEYFNTASSKMILQMMLTLKNVNEKGTKVEFNWHHYDDDEDMIDIAEEAEMLSQLKIIYKIMD